MLTPLKYIGSKHNLSPLIIQSIPAHEVYIEVFGGSAAVLFQKLPSKIEVYNDVNNDIVTLFRVLRDSPEDLKEILELTLFSREEMKEAYKLIRGGKFKNDLQHAWAVFVAFNLSVAGVVTYKRGGFSYGTVRNNTYDYTNRIDILLDLAARLKNVYIENLDFQEIFKKYDSPTSFFYIDPPYVPRSRAIEDHYLSEFGLPEHEKLISCINELQGKCIISGYADSAYDELKGFNKIEVSVKSNSRVDSVSVDRTEVLWLSRGCPLQLNLNL